VIAGLYHAGRSPLHTAPAWVKLLGLAIVLAVVTWRADAPAVAVAVPATAALYGLARIPWRIALDQLRPALWLLAVTFGFQLVTAGPVRAGIVAGQLALAVALAALLSLTTRVSDMLDVVERILGPLRWIGVDVMQVALLLALTIRCIPFVAGLLGEVRQARQARGLSPDPVTIVGATAVRTLRASDRLAEALAARGLAE
jgi:biotin transport system permease protein